ncbi:MAG TPA: integrase family protein [Gammaproteobacteria bacterium]|nr:integrase family protein [Gammaproteobacteria bacterium]
MKLTKGFIDKKAIAPTNKDQAFYRDDELKGFALRVTSSGVKSFVVETVIGNKVRRMTIGRYGKLTAEEARIEAKKILGKIAAGGDPVADKKQARAKSVTLKEVFEEYLKTRKALKLTTVFDYQRVMKEAFSTWLYKPLLDINKDMVARRHSKLGESSHARANLAMRVLRALFNFAMTQYEDSQGRSLITDNPVKRLSQTRAWYRVERRQSFIKAHELVLWHEGVQKLENKTLRDYLLLLVFTGLRRQEAATLKWNQVDFKQKTLTIIDTKNHEPHTLPISDYLYDLLMQRKNIATTEYVFPSSGVGGYIVEPRKQMEKVIQHSGISFIIHDLRRTFLTIAEGLDISAYAVKRLANHKMKQDITSGYIITDVERLRKPMQQITDYLLKCMGVIKSADVMSIEQLKKGIIHEHISESK